MNREIAKIYKSWMKGKEKSRFYEGLYPVFKMSKKSSCFQNCEITEFENVIGYILEVYNNVNFADFTKMCFCFNMYPKILQKKCGGWRLKIFDNLCIDLKSEIPSTIELQMMVSKVAKFVSDAIDGNIDEKNCSKIFRTLMKNIPSYCVFHDVADDGFILYVIGCRILFTEIIDFDEMPDSPEKLRQRFFKICKADNKKITNLLLSNFR